MEEEDKIEESSVRLLGSHSSGGGGGGESRWVDGSELDSESPPWSVLEEIGLRDGYGSMRRRLVKRPKYDSLDVEAMEIAGASGHHAKVIYSFNCHFFCTLMNFPGLHFFNFPDFEQVLLAKLRFETEVLFVEHEWLTFILICDF